jgi:glycerol-3-phosphate dehydrogenase (NAD(P)+)
VTDAIAVIGAGAWGTALAARLAPIRPTVLWARAPHRAAEIQVARENTRYLPGHPIPDSLTVTADAAAALRDACAVLLAVPTQSLRAITAALRAHWPDAAPAALCAKGIERETLCLPSEILAETLPAAPLAVLSGPNFAHELIAGLPAAAVLAADEALRARLLPLLAIPRFRLYGSADVIGVQLGGAAKNVVAIAAGVVEGMGLGENARAALITRGVAELARLVVAEGGRPETAAGLSGLGDLVLTCTGAASRNHSLGIALGRGEALADLLAARVGVTEGVPTAPALLARAARSGTELPIAEAVVALLDGRASAAVLVEALLSRSPKEE